MRKQIVKGMLERQRAGVAGNLKHGAKKIREFRRRVAAGESQRAVARDLGISKGSANSIARRLSYTHVLLLLLVPMLMGNACVEDTHHTVTCQGINYPLCRDVPNDYPCLCLSAPDGVSSVVAQDMRHLND